MPTIRDIILQVSGQGEGAQRTLAEIATELQGLDGTEATATVTLAKEAFDRQVVEAKAELDAVFARTTEARVKVKVDDARAELEQIAREGSAAFEEYFRPRINQGLNVGIIGNLTGLLRDLEPVAQGLENVAADTEHAATAADGGTSTFSKFGDKLSQIQPIAGGVAVVLGISLVGALAAVVASLAAAVAGVGALAVAFAGALGPAALGLFALIQAIGPVLKVVQERQTAAANATYDHAAAAKTAQAAADAEHQAHIGLRDALQSETSARQALTQAIKESRKAIADARNTARDAAQSERDAVQGIKDAETNLRDTRASSADENLRAQRRVKDAIVAVKQAVKDAYAHWKQLAQDVIDDQHAVADSTLGILDAQNALIKAQRGYNSLLNQIPSDKLDGILKKINDVSLSPAQVQDYIKGAMGPGADPGFAQKLYDAYLKLRHAENDLSDATNTNQKAEAKLKKDRKELHAVTKDGLKAYGPYATAVRQLRDARLAETQTERSSARAIRSAREAVQHAREREAQAARRETTAAKALRDLERQGVRDSPRVVSARNAVRDAEERVTEARRRLREASKNAGGATDAMSAALRRLHSHEKALTPQQLALADSISALLKAFSHSFGSQAVLGALAGLVRGAVGVLNKLHGPLQLFGLQFALILRSLGHALTGKGGVGFFKDMLNLAGRLAGPGAEAVAGFARAMAAIARAASPALVRLFQGLASGMTGFAAAASGKGGQKTIQALIGSTFTWLKAIGQVFGTFGRFVKLVAPFGDKLVKAFGKWSSTLFRSGKGADGLKRFFKDTMPFATHVLKLIGAIAKAFIQFFEFIAPILDPFVQLTTSVVNLIGMVFGFLNKLIPAPIREVAGWILTLFLFAPKLVAWLGKLPGILGSIGKLVGKLGIIKAIVDALAGAGPAVAKAAGDVGKALWDALLATLEALEDFGGWLITALGDAASAIGDAVVALAKVIWSGLKAELGLYLKLGEWVGGALEDAAKSIVDAVATVAKAIWNGIKTAFDTYLKIGEWIVSGLGDAAAIGGQVLKWIGDGISAAARAVASVGPVIVGWIQTGLSAIGGWGRDILNAIGNAVKGAISGASDIGASIGHWLIDGIGAALSVGSKILHWIGTDLKKVLGHAAGWGRNIAHWLLDGLGKALQVGGKVIGWLRGDIRKALSRAAGFGHTIANWVMSGLRGGLRVGGKIVGWIKSGLRGLTAVGRDIANWLWNGMKSLPGKILRGLKGAINSVIRGWNNLNFHIGGQSLGPLGHLPSINIGTPNIPFLAAGGIATRGTLAGIGEAGPEAVLPLNARILGALGDSIVSAMRGATNPGFGIPRSGIGRRASSALGGGEELLPRSVTEEHFHVHGHTQRVDPDPRTSAKLLRLHMRKRGL